jgi:phosphate starvation-inducible PhoH-like protein
LPRAVDAFERDLVERIILTRPAVEAGERLGFLPGDLTQKIDPYLRPLYDALYDLMGADRVAKLLRKARHRDRPARLHARPDAEPRLHHPRRGAEHDAGTDEDVPDPHRHRRQGSGHRRHHPDRPAQGHKSGLAKRATSCKMCAAWPLPSFKKEDVVRHPLVARIVAAYESQTKQTP